MLSSVVLGIIKELVEFCSALSILTAICIRLVEGGGRLYCLIWPILKILFDFVEIALLYNQIKILQQSSSDLGHEMQVF